MSKITELISVRADSDFKACALNYYAIPYIFTRAIRIRYCNSLFVDKTVGLEKLCNLARGTLLKWRIWDLDPGTVITEAMLLTTMLIGASSLTVVSRTVTLAVC